MICRSLTGSLPTPSPFFRYPAQLRRYLCVDRREGRNIWLGISISKTAAVHSHACAMSAILGNSGNSESPVSDPQIWKIRNFGVRNLVARIYVPVTYPIVQRVKRLHRCTAAAKNVLECRKYVHFRASGPRRAPRAAATSVLCSAFMRSASWQRMQRGIENFLPEVSLFPGAE